MKTSFVSSLAIQTAMRLTIQRSQSEVQELQKEVVTGRHADIGISLGASSGRSVSLNRDVARLESIIDNNALVTQRLSASQAAMDLMAESAQSLLQAFISVNGADDALRIGTAKNEVRASLDAFTAAVNTSSNGEYLFAGVNTDVKPVSNYLAAGSPPKLAFDALYLGHFGFSQTNPAASGITSAQMEDFLDNTLEPAFLGANWTTDWSSASDTNIMGRINSNTLVETSTNANAAGMRKLALAAVVGLELLGSPVTSEVRALINARAIQYSGEAVTGIDNERSKLGVSEDRVRKADVALAAQIKIVKLYVGDLEGVDAYEASTRMNSLLAQVETSYTLTARIQQLSLINYL